MRLFRLTAIATLTLVALLAACSNKQDEPPDLNVSYRGELQVDFSPQIVGEQWTDTVLFAVHNGIYSITYLTANGNPSALCDVEGEIGGFNTNQVRLTPQYSYFGSNCSQRGPNGEFSAAFTADSLKLDNLDQSAALFILRLKKTTSKRPRYIRPNENRFGQPPADTIPPADNAS